MKQLLQLFIIAVPVLMSMHTHAQTNIKGQVINALTKEAIPGATILCADENNKCAVSTEAEGQFQMPCNCALLQVSSVGYTTQTIKQSESDLIITLKPATSLLQDVVVSATHGQRIQRSQAPIAISVVNTRMIHDTKATMADQLLNKISGVNMVSLGNEQHQMSIRQPMTTKSLFLYLEDGIPIRTTGLYNHNALLEMNLAATRSIEVIKGPSSSLYGSEAIGGVVNFLTSAPPAVPVLKLSSQVNNIGYRRMDIVSGFSKGKWGFAASGYYAGKRNGYLEYSDFNKGIVTLRADYRLSDRSTISNSFTWLNYYSDMSGGIDSAMFASKTFKNQQTFTYRKVNAIRHRTSFLHSWSAHANSTVSILYRNNSIAQNPAYRIKDDYRRQGNVFVGEKGLAHGEINESSFRSFSIIAKHRQSFNFRDAELTGGLSMDISPSSYISRYIRISKDTLRTKYTGYRETDSVLTDYRTGLNNYAAFVSGSISPFPKLKLVGSLRYDLFRYDFDNHLTPSSFSGSADTLSYFHRVSPKIGFTYNFSKRTGVYANYSEGFVPPQVTELYTGVKVPDIKPSVFYNYEIGGWAELVKGKLSVDVSAYILNGTNEIISVKLDDGSFANQNAGKTSHRGIEFGVLATPVNNISFRFGGAYSRHRFVEYAEKGISYNGNEMNNAPRWMYNGEIWYKPAIVKGLRLGMELQHIGEYFVNPQNTASYKGYRVLNVRTGYQRGSVEFWVNVMNVTNSYYSLITSKSAFGYSYQLAEPRNFNVGVSCDLASLFKKQAP